MSRTSRASSIGGGPRQSLAAASPRRSSSGGPRPSTSGEPRPSISDGASNKVDKKTSPNDNVDNKKVSQNN